MIRLVVALLARRHARRQFHRIRWRIEKAKALRRRADQIEADAIRLIQLIDPYVGSCVGGR